MASFFLDSFHDDLAHGNIVPSTDTFKVMLLAPGSTPVKATWAKRSDAATEITGTGYTAGGIAATLTLTAASGNGDLEAYNLADMVWPGATFTAAYAVVYKSRGGLASADNLVCVIDLGGSQSVSGNTFTIHLTSPFGIQN